MTTGMITERQKTKTTGNMIIIFSMIANLDIMTIEIALKKSVKFLKFTTDIIAPNPTALSGVIVSRKDTNLRIRVNFSNRFFQVSQGQKNQKYS